MAMESQGSEATAVANAPTIATSETAVAASVKTVEIATETSTKQTVEVNVTTETTTTTAATETVVTEASASSETTTTSTASPVSEPAKPKKFYGLGNYLPKVPNLLMKKDDKQQLTTTSSSTRGSNHSEENGGSTTDASDARARGVSTDQSSSSFASTIVRRISNFRAQPSSSISESPRNSIDGSMPQQQQRRSLVGASGTGLPSPRGDVNGKPRRGACVATKYGTGVVLDIRDDGFYIVQLVPKSIAYLREDLIIREIKSVVGERVKTRWGLATVEQYYVDEDMYSIALDWRWDDDHVWRMKATTKKFEKIPKGNSIVQNTKNKIFEGYSTIRESASFGYANVAAKINTTASTYKTRAPQQQQAIPPQNQNLGKAVTPYGVCTVLQVRSDQFFVVKTKCGATAYLNADSVKLLHRRTNFAIGDRVKTPYGMGEVVAYRDEDEMYEVKLEFNTSIGSLPPMLYISDLHAETMLVPATSGGANYARLSSIFTMTRNSVYSASATVKASASGGLNTLSTVKSKVSTMAAMKMTKLKFQKGERVITSFGSGFISEVRPLERIYEVQLRRLKFHGYFHELALQAFPYERVTHFIVDGKTIPAPEVPKNAPEHKRRHIINEAIRQAREGK